MICAEINSWSLCKKELLLEVAESTVAQPIKEQSNVSLWFIWGQSSGTPVFMGESAEQAL